jgi:hypothetical protein
MQSPTTSLNPSHGPPLQSGHSSGASMESAAGANTILHNSKRPQRNAATKAAERLTQIEHSPTEDSTLKKRSPAAFQLTNKAIPDDAGHIKVSRFDSRTGL